MEFEDGMREARFWKKSLPSPSVSATYLCTAQTNVHISHKINTLGIKKNNNNLYKQAFCLDYKKFHSATEGVGCLAHPYARMPTGRKKNNNKKNPANQQPNNLHFLNAKFMPHKPGDISILLSRYQI